MLKENSFYLKFGTPIDDNLTVDKFLNKLTQIKKGSSRDFHVRNGNSTISSHNHCA